MKTKGAIRQKFLSLNREEASASHSGPMCTLQVLILYFYWPSMETDVKNYCDTCDACQHNKYPVHASPGIFHPNPSPNMCWAFISINFLTGITMLYGPDSTLVVVYQLNKMANFIGDKFHKIWEVYLKRHTHIFKEQRGAQTSPGNCHCSTSQTPTVCETQQMSLLAKTAGKA